MELETSAYVAKGEISYHKSQKTVKASGYNNHKDKECFYCHKMGHIKSDCHKRIADEKIANERSAALMATKQATEDDMYRWALDSGSTQHLTPYKCLFDNLRDLEDDTYITFGNKTKEKALETSS